MSAAVFTCSADTIYAQNSAGQVVAVNVSEGPGAGSTSVQANGQQNNGLGIADEGATGFTINNGTAGSTKKISIYDGPSATTQTKNLGDGNAPGSIIRGAVDPTTGVYYYAGAGTSAYLGAYNPSQGVAIGQIGWITNLKSGNGDFAFSSTGALFVAADNEVRVVDQNPVPTSPSTSRQLSTSLVATLPSGVAGNGIAFGNGGNLFVSSGTSLYEVDPASGEHLRTIPLSGGFSMTDLASCSYPNTLTVQKDIVDRFAPNDQFGLSVTGGAISEGNTATTSGSANGVQAQAAGPVYATAGTRYTVSESAAGSARMSNYVSSIACIDTSTGAAVPVTGSGPSWQLTYPQSNLGIDVVCTITNDPLDKGYTVEKTSDPESGTPVSAGDTIIYTVSATNDGETVLDPASVTDDLSGVLEYATYAGDASATIDGEPASDPEVSGTQLEWTGSLDPGQTVEVTYSVQADADSAGQLLRNTASGTAVPPGGEPITPPGVSTEHAVNEPGFEVHKTADPASGTAVDAGSTVTYTVTGQNTGATVLDPAEVVDDLSGVLTSAAFNDDASATIDGEPADAPALEDDQLTWSGALDPGQTVSITYSVTVDDDAAGETLENAVSGTAVPPGGGDPLTTPPETVTNPVNEPGFSLSKSVDPASGEAVNPGDVLTYTVVGENSGQTALDPVDITDDLSSVLEHASFNGDATATINGEPATAPGVDEDALTWSGSRPVGASVTITYTVTVDGDAGGETLVNSAEGSAVPPGGGTITPPPSNVENPVNEPGFEFSKSVDPESGTAVDPGRVLTYTLTGENTGQTALDPVEIADDLSAVLAGASYNDDAAATVNGEPVEGLTVGDGQLSWNGSLAVGETVTVTYSVTVNPDAGGETLSNSATGAATPPGGNTITPPPGQTETPVREPGFEFSKSVDPASGTAVDPGSVLTYTLTGENT
ncbi:DUF7927 domain-containing protein, partial [Microbacterium gubbeenense]|uniref:DUF7927 domain-containing protein n=1 Tax=Microbacterium gubbeenense TaxID=159896 RepID=UPI003F9C0C39